IPINQFARTPPPWPPRAAMVSLIDRSEGILQPLALTPPLEETNHRTAHLRQQPIPTRRVVNQLGPIKRWAQYRGVRDLAAYPAPDTAVIDMRDRIGPQRIGTLFYSQ